MPDLERLHGDCRAVLATLPADSIDACVTDPPYELAFMGRQWDATGVAFQVETWREVLRVLKPGAHLVAFGGPRTQHRMVCAIEDAGFEIRDCLMWLYSCGFPKSHDVSKGIDKAAGAERAVIGHDAAKAAKQTASCAAVPYGGNGNTGDITAPATPEAAQWSGWGTALKPAWEPIVLARKPLIGTVAQNVLAHGCGGLNIDASRVATTQAERDFMVATSHPNGTKAGNAGGVVQFGDRPGGFTPSLAGRWPANVLHDGSDEVEAAFAAFGERTSGAWDGHRNKPKHNNVYGTYGDAADAPTTGSTGSASRFFYSAKAGKADRAGSKHPTVKPLALMRWLCRLICPPGGRVLDPFAGSGTTGEAAMLEGFGALLIEQAAEHSGDIEHRIGRWHGADLPLFAEAAD